MRHFMIRLLATAAVAAACSPASAQTPIQLRVNVQPAASDPIWQTLKGVNLEKEAECYYSTETTAPKVWIATARGIFKAKTALFNPGQTTWTNGKQVFLPNTAPESVTNTLFLLAVGYTPQTKSLVCRARILANGQNVTANTNDIMFALADNISKLGPPIATVKLDQTKLPKSPVQPIAKKTTKFTITELRFDAKKLKASNNQYIEILSKDAVSCTDAKGKVAGYWNVAGCVVKLSWTLKRDGTLGEITGAQAPYLFVAVGYPNEYLELTWPFKFADGQDMVEAEGEFYISAPSGTLPKSKWCRLIAVVTKKQPDIQRAEIFANVCINNLSANNK